MKTLLNIKSLVKIFPGVMAVDRVSLDLEKGEILALIGENGAGKSTLTKIICGVLKPDDGNIFYKGKEVKFHSSYDAMAAGINLVFQELSLIEDLSIAENIFMNRQPLSWMNKIDWKKLYQQTEELLEKFSLKLNPKTLVKKLSSGQQQMVEILKAVSTSPDILILDEPTSSLTESEIHLLYNIIKKLKEAGVAFIYITHKLSEVFKIADRVFVMRDGRYVDSKPVKDVNEKKLISIMVGREITKMYGTKKQEIRSAEKILEVSDLSLKDHFNNISFHLDRGEILGIAGLVGAGRTEMALSIFGAVPRDSGSIKIKNKNILINKPADAIRNGLAYLTEDRKSLGLYLDKSVQENIIAPNLRSVTLKNGRISKKAVTSFVNMKIKEFNIVTSSTTKKIIELSGGNQQKCLYSMWLGTQPDIIILDEPTRGIDVGARKEFYDDIRKFTSKKKGIILISSDLLELIGLSDRILVMHQGRISSELSKKDFTEEKILTYATGNVPGDL